jgi:uncharacterized membrane-anchored protein YhcB (DUF1043 family)
VTAVWVVAYLAAGPVIGIVLGKVIRRADERAGITRDVQDAHGRERGAR